MTPVKPDAVRWLLDLRGRALEWVARQPAGGETSTYAHLMFAFALAKMGAREEAHSALTESLTRVPAPDALEYGFDAAHEMLRAAFRFRIEEALGGRPHAGSLAPAILAAVQGMPTLAVYVVDRLRSHLRILEPSAHINPYPWGQRQSGFENALAELQQETRPAVIRLRVKQFLAGGVAGTALSIYRAVLERPDLPSRELAGEAIRHVLTTAEGPDGVKRPEDAQAEIQLLTLAFRQATARGLAELMSPLLSAGKAWCIHGGWYRTCLAALITAAVEGMWAFRMGEEADCFLNEVSGALYARPAAADQAGPQRLTALLAVADGWFRFGWGTLTTPIFSAVEAVYCAGLPARESAHLAAAVALAVRSAPLATADACFRRLFAGLPPIRDTYTTSTHYGVSVLTVVEAVCLSAAEVAGRMMHE